MASKSLHSIIVGSAGRGPSLTAGIINRLADVVADYHHTYARDIAVCLDKGLQLPASGERGPHYFTALHGLTIAVSALDPTEAAPWEVAVKLHRSLQPSFVTHDAPGKNLLSAIGDVNDDKITIAATERCINDLAAYARVYSGGDMGQRHVSYKMLITALSVLNTDEHTLARRLIDPEPATR